MPSSSTAGATRTTPVPRDGGSGVAGADAAPPPGSAAGAPTAAATAARAQDNSLSGSAVPVGTGIAAVARIPIPGTNGLHLELTPRGWTPPGGSTSTVFLQDATGKRQLRLDYGFNKASGGYDYHWNQSKTFSTFGIPDHTTVGKAGEALYKGAKYFRYGGRVLLVAGAAVDIYSIVVAKNGWRQTTRVASGWAGSWAGCEAGGALGAAGGTLVEPGGGTVVGGFGGCIAGGIAGYWGASWAAGHAYDWVQETLFEPVPAEFREEGQ